MITAIRVRNRRAIREEQSLLLVHGSGSDAPEGAPTSAAGIWGPHGSGKSSLIDQMVWLWYRLRGLSSWKSRIPTAPNRSGGQKAEKLNMCVIEARDETGDYEYTLGATPEEITTEQLVHRPDPASDTREIILDRGRRDVWAGAGIWEDESTIGPDLARTPMLAAEGAKRNPATAAMLREISKITAVRTTDSHEMDGHITLAVGTAQSDEPPSTPGGLRRRLLQGLLENLGIELEDLTDRGSANIAAKLEDAGDSAMRGVGVAVHAAHVLTHGGLLIVDPVDCGIHSAWTRQLIEIFKGQPPDSLNRGQLLFTTGSSDLLTDLPADQIWLMDRSKDEGAKIESLGSFQGVDRTTVRRAYEVGRFGGAPGCAPPALQRATNELYGRQRNAETPPPPDGEERGATEAIQEEHA